VEGSGGFDPDLTMAPRVYLAGPEVFLPQSEQAGLRDAKLAHCRTAGLLGVFPTVSGLTGATPSGLEARATGHQWFIELVEQLRSCDLAIANLTPFRGPSADAGTIWEVGFLIGGGVPVFAYTNDGRDYRHRAERWADPDHAVEDFGLTDNLMLDRSIPASNGGIEVARTAVGAVTEFTDLSGFAECVRACAAHPIVTAE